MDEMSMILDAMIEVSGRRTTHVTRLNLVTKKFKQLLTEHANYVIGLAHVLKPEVSLQLLNDFKEFGEIVKEIGECMEDLGEDFKVQTELDIELIDHIKEQDESNIQNCDNRPSSSATVADDHNICKA